MRWEKTGVLPASEIATPAMMAKYRHERERRLRKEGQKQYVKLSEETPQDHTHDPYTEIAPREPVVRDMDTVILGAGWTGVCAAVHLKNAGVEDFAMVDHAGDLGGTW